MPEQMYRMAQAIVTAETMAEYFRCRGWHEAADRWQREAKVRQQEAVLWAAQHYKTWGRIPVQAHWNRVLLGYCSR